MKLHLPGSLFRVLLACVALAGSSFAESADSVTYASHQNGPQNISGQSDVIFENIRYTGSGAAIYQGGGTASGLSLNDSVSFNGNTAAFQDVSAWWNMGDGGAICNRGAFALDNNVALTFIGNNASGIGGAICNWSIFSLSGNGEVYFSRNTASSSSYQTSGGAICNHGTFTLYGNGAVTFNANTSSTGGALANWIGTFTLSGNGDVTFSGCSASSSGGAIANCFGTFTLSGNGDVSFSGNVASASSTFFSSEGGAIDNSGTFILKENGNVLFEKNAEVFKGVYHLRSIYSAGKSTLDLSASEGKSILFKDSVYASGTVNLNQDGTGDIIFTGASTEADLREVKGGVDGTAEEILNSRTSEIASNATLYGGRLMVEDEAILKVNSLSVVEGASIVIKDGTLALNNAKATITTAAGAEKAVLTGASPGESSLAGADAEHRGVVDGAHIDLAEGADFSMQHLVLSATTRITDAPATLLLDDVTAELVMGVNATLNGTEELLAGIQLMQSGNSEVILTLTDKASVQLLESDIFDSVALSGNSLVLELTELPKDLSAMVDFIGISFTSGTDAATFASSLAVTLSIDGVCYGSGYTMVGEDGPTTMYFRGGKDICTTPEPATATLSLLALAAFAARRRRRRERRIRS